MISSPAVAEGTPRLDPEAAERFDAGFAGVRALAAERIGGAWVSRLPRGGEASGALT